MRGNYVRDSGRSPCVHHFSLGVPPRHLLADRKAVKLTKVAQGETERGYFCASNDFEASEPGGTRLDALIHFARGGWESEGPRTEPGPLWLCACPGEAWGAQLEPSRTAAMRVLVKSMSPARSSHASANSCEPGCRTSVTTG
jgi:hypothetical protein